MNKSLDQKIISYMKLNNKFVTANTLSSKFNVARKTIIRHVKSINERAAYNIIISKKGKGYKLSNSFLQLNNKAITDASSVKLRQENIIKKLLFASPRAIRIADLIQEFYVSESVIQSDEKNIIKIIKKWNLRLKRKQRSISIIGKEENIRNALIEMVLHLNNSIDIQSIKESVGQNNERDFEFALQQVEMALRFLNGSLSYPYNVNFFAHIYVLLNRAKTFKSINKSLATNRELVQEVKKNPEIFSVCQKIVKNISNYLGIPFPDLEDEIYYLFEYLVSSRFNSFDGIKLNDTELSEKVTSAYIDMVSKSLNTKFDETIKTDIKNHVLSMISRLKMNISLPNALLDDIKFEYPDIFKATKEASKKISDLFNLPIISEDEVGFLCLYFAKYFEMHSTSNQRIRTFVICTTGIGTAGIISAKIRKKIPEIKIIGMVSNINIDSILKEEKDVDLLISTVPLKTKLKIPVEIVSAFFTKQDEEKVRAIVKELQNNKS